jgi:hypothetical protein
MNQTTQLLFEALDALQQAQNNVRAAIRESEGFSAESASCSLQEADDKIFSAIVELHLVITVHKNDQSKIQSPRRFPS